MSNFYIYTIHNIINNKIYVGKTSDPEKRWRHHIDVAFSSRKREQFYVHRAILKYGVDSFIFTAFHKLNNEQDCYLAEQYWIKYFQSKDPKYGYNLTDGGEGTSGRIISEVTRQKMREKATGRKHTKETIFKMTGDNNHRSKLNFDEVKEIRHKYNFLKYSLAILAESYKVSSRTIARSVYNIDWYDQNYIPPIARKTKGIGVPKLNQEKANEIRVMYSNGTSTRELSNLFNVCIENIQLIVNGKIWKNNA